MRRLLILRDPNLTRVRGRRRRLSRTPSNSKHMLDHRQSAVLGLAAALIASGACSVAPSKTVTLDTKTVVTVKPRTPELRTYPCVEQCHANLPANFTKRPLREFHTLRTIKHGASMFWCNFCHKPDNLDELQLLDGTPVSFNSPQRLCGQCHGDKLRDWSLGIHGLQTGDWRGPKVRRACPACHNPHDPHRPTFVALPPPEIGHREEDGL